MELIGIFRSFKRRPAFNRSLLRSRRRHRGQRIKVDRLQVRFRSRDKIPVLIERIQLGQDVEGPLRRDRLSARRHRAVEVDVADHRKLAEVQTVISKEVLGGFGEHRSLLLLLLSRVPNRGRLVRKARLPMKSEVAVDRGGEAVFVKSVVAVSEEEKKSRVTNQKRNLSWIDT